MNNRFKVRAWLIDEKRMVDVYSVRMDGSVDVEDPLYHSQSSFAIMYDSISRYETISDEKHIKMQCTGLLATSSYRGESDEDRLIYEGDIVHTNNNAAYVEYTDVYDQLEFVSITHDCGFDRNNCIIVGNVYEHKKLLDKNFWEYEVNSDEDIAIARKKERKKESSGVDGSR